MIQMQGKTRLGRAWLGGRCAVLLASLTAGCFSLGPLWSDDTGGSGPEAGAGCGTFAPVLGPFGFEELTFRHVCPVSTNIDGGTAADAATDDDGGTYGAAPPNASVVVRPYGSDIDCVVPSLAYPATIAVGAPFRLEYVSLEDASAPPQPVVPAIQSLTELDADGYRAFLPQTSFVVWQGPQMLDFIDVAARPALSLGLFRPGDIDAATALADASAYWFYEGAIGVAMTVIAYPRSADGVPLGGSMSCTFTSSDPGLLTVTGQGIVAQVTPLTVGETTLTASCMGMTSVAQILGIPQAPTLYDDSDAQADDEAGDSGNDATLDADVDGGAPHADASADAFASHDGG
jgi:hypothetical protein